jgi:hypothetical protein
VYTCFLRTNILSAAKPTRRAAWLSRFRHPFVVLVLAIATSKAFLLEKVTKNKSIFVGKPLVYDSITAGRVEIHEHFILNAKISKIECAKGWVSLVDRLQWNPRSDVSRVPISWPLVLLKSFPSANLWILYCLFRFPTVSINKNSLFFLRCQKQDLWCSFSSSHKRSENKHS